MGAVWINCKSLIFIVWGQQGYKLDKDVLFKIMEITSEEQKIQKEMTKYAYFCEVWWTGSWPIYFYLNLNSVC